MSHTLGRRFVLPFLPSLVPVQARAASSSDRLNVLFTAIDDLNVDLDTFGHDVVRPPNVDRLAARGVKFDRAYGQFPLCNPSPQSFLSGLRPETSGVVAQGLTVRAQRGDYIYLPGWFSKHGYQVIGTGKIFHGKDPASWDHYEDANSSSPQENAALKNRSAVRERGEPGSEGRPIDDADDTMGDGIVGGAVELYDEENDPGEYRNLAADPARAREIASLKALLARNPRLAGPVPADAQAGRKNRKK